MQNGQIRYFSMFTGVGGFELGINSNNNQCSAEKLENGQGGDRHTEKQGKMLCTSNKPTFSCVGFSEIDKYANQLLANKFPEVRNYGDATKINASKLPDFDMLCGGFPCQSFSIAGKRRGFEDTRGTMFFHIARILEVKRPKVVFLENVKGLLNHDKGETFKVIIQTLSELGYDVQWMVLNSKFFGVPQNRERVFIIGSLRGEPRPEILPFRGSSEETNSINNQARQEINIIDDVARVNKFKQGDRIKMDGNCFTLNSIEQRGIVVGTLDTDGWEKRHENIRRVWGTESIAPTIPCGTGGGVMTKIAIDLYNHKEHLDRTPALTEPHHNSLRIKEGLKIRKLTPTECERLQGFPDGWTSGFSDTQRYKMMGNAVTVNVIKAIANKLRFVFENNQVLTQSKGGVNKEKDT